MREMWTPEQYKAHLAKPKRSKYGSKKAGGDGHKFDSRKEAKVYGQLKIRERIGEISNLELQPMYEINIEGKKIFKYFADFRYIENGQTVVVDVKSPATKKKVSYRIKKKAVEAQFGITILEV